MGRHSHREAGFSHIAIILVLLIIGLVSFAGWRVYRTNQNTTQSSPSATVTKTTQTITDSASTIDSPSKISTKIGNQYFYYGSPKGQNNASPKKILITIHGTEGSAEKDYEIWKPYIKETSFALASLNWWDGNGDKTTDYSTPEVMSSQIQDFLSSQNYTKNDIVVFEGFSRGSANSYSVAAFDRASTNPLIDVVVSSSGGLQEDYFNLTTKEISSKIQSNIFSGIYWILACGGKDSNPTRDGCGAMEASKKFVSDKGASILGILSDSNSGHGALTTSSTNLPKQMFELIDQASIAR